MRKILWVVLAMLAIAVSVQARTNTSDKAAIERGRVLYGQYCASCHGHDGTGGPPATSTAKHPPDLTLMEQQFGIFLGVQLESAIRGTDPIVAHGSPGMMLWAAIFRRDARQSHEDVDGRIRDLIAFIESIQQKRAANAPQWSPLKASPR